MRFRGFMHLPSLLCLILLALLIPAAQAEDICVDDKLVNHCRMWFGANAGQYTEAGTGTRNQIVHFEKRIGRQVDIVHTYHGIGDNALSEEEYYFIQRPGTILFTNWKPAARWSDAAGSNNAVNATIDQMANSIKKAAPRKIFLTIHHEPEDQVEGDTSCTSYSNKEKAGVPSDYRAMWRNIRQRFEALGVDNVVWVMNYMGYERWQCLVNDMWPGNELVDWIMWNSYATPRSPWPDAPLRLYDFLSANSTTEHDYLSKPWGLGEFGAWAKSRNFVLQQFDAMYQTLENTDIMPRLRLYVVFDNRDSRVGYTDGKPDLAKQVAFNRIANHSRFTQSIHE